jgi:hypothetical protein
VGETLRRIPSVAIIRRDNSRFGVDGDEYPPARQSGTTAATESRRGGAAVKFPLEPNGERPDAK